MKLLSRWSWARKEITKLTADTHYHRIAHLSFEVRYGAPIFLHGLFAVAFVYNVGYPQMARILHRNGKGPILRDTHKRNFDSMTFFGELYRHGEDEQGLRIIERLNRIHGAFPIDNSMHLYTLSSLALLPQRVSEKFAGSNGLSEKECEAQFLFWRRLGELMNIVDIPLTRQDFLEWAINFEQARFEPSVEGLDITEALAREWVEYWFPRPLQPFFRGFFYALIDPNVRILMGLSEPTYLQKLVARITVRTFFEAKRFLPDPSDRYMSDFFGLEYGGKPDAETMGYHSDKP